VCVTMSTSIRTTIAKSCLQVFGVPLAQGTSLSFGVTMWIVKSMYSSLAF
jgi:hypothetical protein